MDMYGERLRYRRKSKGLSQTKLADLAGCTSRTVIRYEKHGIQPGKWIGERIAGVLGEF